MASATASSPAGMSAPIAGDEVRWLARKLAAAHARAVPAAADTDLVRAAMRARWDSVLAGLRRQAVDAGAVTEIEQRAHQFLAGRAALFADRIGRGKVTAGHHDVIAGLDPRISVAAAYREGVYTTEWTERTYSELLWRADLLLGRAETVVLDASWRRQRHRVAARAIGAGTSSTLIELRCAGAVRAAGDDWPEAHVIGAGSAGLNRAVALIG